MSFFRFSPVWLGVGLLVLLGSRCCNASMFVSPNRHNAPKTIKVPFQQAEVPVGYLEYPMPPFSVQFKTVNTLSGDPEMDATLLQSEMATPLKEVVAQFFRNIFNYEVQELIRTAPETTNEVIFEFVTVDFALTIQHQFSQDPVRRLGEAPENEADWYIDFYAEFVGIAFFLAPAREGGEIPEPEYMYKLMLEWMNRNLNDGMDDLIADFQSSQSGILNNLQTIEIDTDIEVGGDDLATPQEASNSSYEQDPENKRGHGVEVTFVVFLCLVFLVVGATIVRYSASHFVPYFQDHSIDPTAAHIHNGTMALERPISPRDSEQNSLGPKKNEPLPGRRPGDADEEEIMRQHSDRWLMENRPDLYDVVHRAAVAGEETKRVSLPFQFLSGGLLHRSGQQQVQPQTNAPHFSEGQDPEASPHEGVLHAGTGIPYWWTMVLQSLRAPKLACDEDPSQYPFPFQDFPRHDGTPCLMYRETADGAARIVRADDPSNSNPRPFSPTDPLSNEDFKRVLSLNSEDGGLNDIEDEEDDILYSGTQTSADTEWSPGFTERLQRLIEMRLRHYERQTILEKHKKKSDQRSQDAVEEARQRELKLRRHEMELDVNEIEAQCTPRAVTDRRSELAATNAPSNNGSPARSDDGGATRTHRATASDPDICVVGGEKEGRDSLEIKKPACRSSSNGDIDFVMDTPVLSRVGSSRGNIMRFEPPLPRHATAERRRADPPPSSLSVIQQEVPAATLARTPTGMLARAKGRMMRNPSHRRWASHGTGSSDGAIVQSASMDDLGRRNSELDDGNSEDVMTFGIAAYTNFV